MPNKTLTFKTDILPYSDGEYNIGNSSAKWKVNGYVISGAAEKNVDTVILDHSTSQNLPTSAAVSSYVEGKGYLVSTLKGAANGLAELNENGKILSSQLPSFVDEIREYPSRDDFPLTGTSGLIYIDEEENQTYRWSGSEYVEISPSLALGTTSSTAYRGDYGNIAYQHATDNEKLSTAQLTGFYKISTTAEGHIKAVTPVTKNDIIELGISVTDTKVTQEASINTNNNYPILIAKNAGLTTQTDTVNKTSTLTYNPSTKALVTNGTVDGFKLAAASAKNVTDNTTSTAPNVNDTNLITGRTLYNSITTSNEIDSLFPGQSTYDDFATAAEIAALFT